MHLPIKYFILYIIFNLSLSEKIYKNCASFWSTSRYLAHFSPRTATAHRKLRKLWKARLVVTRIYVLLGPALVVVERVLLSTTPFRLLLAIVKPKIRVRNVPLTLVLNHTRMWVLLSWFLVLLSLDLQVLFLYAKTFSLLFSALVIVTLVWLLLVVFFYFICTVFIFIKSLFEVLFFLFHSILLFVSLDEWFYFAFGFLLERINSLRNILREIAIRLFKVLGLCFFKLLKLFDILLVHFQLVKVVLLIFFLLLMSFFYHRMRLFGFVFKSIISLRLLIISVKSLTNLGVIQVHNIAFGPVSASILF